MEFAYDLTRKFQTSIANRERYEDKKKNVHIERSLDENIGAINFFEALRS